MVFFTCNHCGDSAKKPSVDKHYQTKCRGNVKNVSCMDCQKDFHGEEYVAHTKCISEAQKYSGKGYVEKEKKNNNAKKQESWMDIIRSILETREYNLNAKTRSAFERLQSVDNVPRKKAKFQNFVSNCMRMPQNQAEDVWNVLEKELEKMKQANQQKVGKVVPKEFKQETEVLNDQQEDTPLLNGHSKVETSPIDSAEKKKSKDQKKRKGTQQNGHDEPASKQIKTQTVTELPEEPNSPTLEVANETKSKKQKKREATLLNALVEPVSETIMEAQIEAASAQVDNVEFQWMAVLEKLVAGRCEGISLEKLKNKVLKKYIAKQGLEGLAGKQRDKFEKKFRKNLKKCPTVQVVGEVVQPCLASC